MDQSESLQTLSIAIVLEKKDASLEEAIAYVDKIVNRLMPLIMMHDLVTLYRRARQLSDTFFSYPKHRVEIAKHLTETGFPALASKFIKKLNKLGVFSQQDTWYATFYFYSIVWNYSDVYPDFATSMAISGLMHLLNLNISHQPYLQNINSQNVYFLIKASLCIMHNVSQVPGNRDMVYYDVGRDGLLSIIQSHTEDSLQFSASQCLAYILHESELSLTESKIFEKYNLLQLLLSHVWSAQQSTKRMHHGISLADLLTAVGAFVANDSFKQVFIHSDVQKISIGASTDSSRKQKMNAVTFLVRLLETFSMPNASDSATDEAIEAIRMIYLLMFTGSLKNEPKMRHCISKLTELSQCMLICKNEDKALIRVIESALWQSTQARKPYEFRAYTLPDPNGCGPLIVSFAPINQESVQFFYEQIMDNSIHIFNDIQETKIPTKSAQDLGLSALSASFDSNHDWLDCLNKATVMLVCLSDAYRMSPGCRSELEYFMSTNSEDNPKQIVYLILPPRYTPTSWTASLPGIEDAFDFTHKNTFMSTLHRLIITLARIYGVQVNPDIEADLESEAEAGSHRSYISLDDLNVLKSTSMFLSTSSDLSQSDEILQGMNTMFVLGGTRPEIVSEDQLAGKAAEVVDAVLLGKQDHHISSIQLSIRADLPQERSDSDDTNVEKDLPFDEQPAKESSQALLDDSKQLLPPIAAMSAVSLSQSVKPVSDKSSIVADHVKVELSQDQRQQVLTIVAPEKVVAKKDGESSYVESAAGVAIEANTCPSISLASVQKSVGDGGHMTYESLRSDVQPIQSAPTESKYSKSIEISAQEKGLSHRSGDQLADDRSNAALSIGTRSVSEELKSIETVQAAQNPAATETRVIDSACESERSYRITNVSTTKSSERCEIEENQPPPCNTLKQKASQTDVFDQPVSDKSAFGKEEASTMIRSMLVSRCAPGWNEVVLPSIRDWSTAEVTSWLGKKKLHTLTESVAGGLDGVLLSQLVTLRCWAPEYFAKCMHNELGLNFIEGLRFVDALEELMVKRQRNVA